MRPLSTLLLLSIVVCCASAKAACSGNAARHRDLHCALDEFSRVEKELDATYQNLLDAQTDESEKHLRIVQRAWLTFRDADAKFVAEHESEPAKVQLLFINQQLDITLLRLQELQKMLPKQQTSSRRDTNR
jgi:uncharacterized protein YecT (DUF1311 family)